MSSLIIRSAIILISLIVLSAIFTGCQFSFVTGSDTVYLIFAADDYMYGFDIDKSLVDDHIEKCQGIDHFSIQRNNETIYDMGMSNIKISHDGDNGKIEVWRDRANESEKIYYRYSSTFDCNRITWKKILKETGGITSLSSVDLKIRVIY